MRPAPADNEPGKGVPPGKCMPPRLRPKRSGFARLWLVPILGLWMVPAIADGDAMPPAMVKSESGVPLDSDIDWSMCAPDGVAVGGYDLVSYRQPDGPDQGDPAHAAEYEGSTYWFVDEENRSRFLDDPAFFLPAYSGFCAITLALGRVTCPEYTNFKIEDDRLLLFEVTGFTNGRTLWNSDAAVFRRQADTNFERLTERR